MVVEHTSAAAAERAQAAPAQRSFDITHAHRTLLRRIERNEPAGDLSHLLVDVCAEGLAEWASKMGPSNYRLTDDGRTVLERHDNIAGRVPDPFGATTRKTPRPVPPPPGRIPFGWQRSESTIEGVAVVHYVHEEAIVTIGELGAVEVQASGDGCSFAALADVFAWLSRGGR